MDGSWDRGREIKVLCPGAGLGRLMWEIARLGIQRQPRSLLDGHEVLTVLDGLPRVHRLHVPRQRVLVLYAARWQLCIEPVRAGGWRVLEHCSRDASVSLHGARCGQLDRAQPVHVLSGRHDLLERRQHLGPAQVRECLSWRACHDLRARAELSVRPYHRAYKIPDVLPRDLPSTAGFSMCAGDFVEIYRHQPAEWDCIVTCFFIDTAHNVIDYIEIIEGALKPGGVWINLGTVARRASDRASDRPNAACNRAAAVPLG